MTLVEFRAWFEGFSDGISEAPTKEQWAKVVDKVKTLPHGHIAPIYRGDPLQTASRDNKVQL